MKVKTTLLAVLALATLAFAFPAASADQSFCHENTCVYTYSGTYGEGSCDDSDYYYAYNQAAVTHSDDSSYTVLVAGTDCYNYNWGGFGQQGTDAYVYTYGYDANGYYFGQVYWYGGSYGFEGDETPYCGAGAYGYNHAVIPDGETPIGCPGDMPPPAIPAVLP